MRVLVITSGGFDPIHDGHIDYLERASNLYKGNGNQVSNICIVNKDQFLVKKKGYAFYSEEQRLLIVSMLRCVDNVMLAIDEDMTVVESIKAIYYSNKMKYDKIVFAKGGDRHIKEIPEAPICRQLGIEMVDGLGKKISSSSALVDEAKRKEKSAQGGARC